VRGAGRGRQLALGVLLVTLVAHVSQLWRLTEPICSALGAVAAPVYWPEVAKNIRATKEPRSYVIDMHGVVGDDLTAADTADHGYATG
jgi:hypothetical protein